MGRPAAKASELAKLDDTEHLGRTTAADLEALRDKLWAALNDGTPQRIKTVRQELAEEVA